MRYLPLGNSDVKVSAICLGTMTFGEQNSAREACEQLDYALANGVNFIDAAEMYPVPANAETAGRTEEYIGNWLARRRRRSEVIIATKVAGPSKMDWLREGGTDLSAKQIKAAIEGSLKRLQTDYVDLYQLHWPARKTNYFGALNYRHDEDGGGAPLAESLGAMGDLIRAGKVRYAGLSNETPWGASHSLALAMGGGGMPRIVSVQNPYNLLNRVYEVGMAEISIRERCGLLAYSPLAFGALSGKYLGGAKPPGARLTRWPSFGRYGTPAGVAAVEEYAQTANKRGINLAQMALAFVLSRRFVTSCIIGATTMEQLQTDIAAADLRLDEETLAAIEAIGARHINPCP